MTPRLVRAIRLLALTMICAAAAAGPAAAQSLAGRVARDGEPRAGVEVELHRVSGGGGAVVGRARTGADGRFSLPLPPRDTAGFTLFFATATHDGVRYFGPAVQGDGSFGGEYEIAVFDTTSSPAAASDSVRVVRRDVFVLPAQAGGGGWEIAEIVRLRNGARRTLVGAPNPAVSLAIPSIAADFRAGDGSDQDAPGAADLARSASGVGLTTPLIPGEREVIFRYRLPADAGSAALPVGRATDTLNLYVRQPSPTLRVIGVLDGVPVESSGERFFRYSRTGLDADDRIALEWRASSGRGIGGWVIAAVAAALLGAIVIFLRRRKTA